MEVTQPYCLSVGTPCRLFKVTQASIGIDGKQMTVGPMIAHDYKVVGLIDQPVDKHFGRSLCLSINLARTLCDLRYMWHPIHRCYPNPRIWT